MSLTGVRFWLMNRRYLLLSILIVAVLISELVRAHANPTGGFVIRQYYTLGMALGIQMDWMKEGISAWFGSLWLPRLLDRGLDEGYAFAEFQILNFLLAPLFHVLSPRWVSFIASVALGAFNFWASLRAVRWMRLWYPDLSTVFGICIYYSIHGIAMQTTNVMPDTVSWASMVIGISLLVDQQARIRNYVGAGLLFALAYLEKPVAIVGIGPALVLLLYRRRGNHKEVVRLLLTGALSLIPAYFWYRVRGQQIALIDQYEVFNVVPLQPLKKLQEFDFSAAISMLVRQIHKFHFPIYTGFLWFALLLFTKAAIAGWTILAALGVMMLDGVHLWQHTYYFYGVNLLTLSGMAVVLHRFKNRPWINSVLVATVVWGMGHAVRSNFWNAHRAGRPWIQAQSLEGKVPSDDVLITDDNDPTKLYFLKRPGFLRMGSGNCLQIRKKAGDRITVAMNYDRYQSAISAADPCVTDLQKIGRSENDVAPWILLRNERKQGI